MNNPTQTHEDSNIGLTMEDKIVALLKWMGWDFEIEDGKQYWSHADYPEASERPPLTLDLMFEAEGKLTREQQDEYVNRHLYDLLPCDENHGPCDGADGDDIMIASQFQVAHAAKEQRLEALLKTIGTAQG